MDVPSVPGSRPQRPGSPRLALVILAALASALAACSAHPAGTTHPAATTHPASATTPPAAGGGSPPAPGTGTTGPPGLPPYYVTLVSDPQPAPSGGPGGEVIEVRATATGRLTDDLPLTAQLHSQLDNPYDVLAAAADQRTFFVSHPADFNSTQTGPVATSIYRFRLSGAGRITGFAKVAQGAGGEEGQFAMTASPDGQKIAMMDPAAGPGAIAVADLTTGQRTVWTGTPGPQGTSHCCGLLAWAGDNRTLVVTQGDPGTERALDVRALDTSGPAGSLAGSRHLTTVDLVSLPGVLSGAVLSPDGRTITALVVFAPNSHGEQPPGRDEVVDISAASGQPTRVLFSQPSRSSISSGSDFGDQLAADGRGHLLQGGGLGAGTPQAPYRYVVNWFDGRTFHPLHLDLRPSSTLISFTW